MDTAPTAETTEHSHPPAPSQEDETTSSSKRTSVSAALENLSVPKAGWAHISFPSSHASPVPIQDGLGISAWLLAHSTPCILTGECVIAHVYVFCTPTTQMTGMSLLARLHTSCMTPQGGTDIASSLFPASLLPISEAPAACNQGQAKEGKRALQLRDCCQPTGVSASPSIQERECRAPLHCLPLHLVVDPAQVMVLSQNVSSWGDGAPFFNSVSGNNFSNSSLVQNLPRLPLMADPVLDQGEMGGILPLGVGQLGLWQSCGVWLLLSGFSIKGCV